MIKKVLHVLGVIGAYADAAVLMIILVLAAGIGISFAFT